MKLTPRAVAYVLTEEGLVPEAYLDSKFIWTWAGGLATTGGFDVLQYKDKPAPLGVCLRATIEMVEAKYLPAVARAFAGRDLAEHEIAAALSFQWRNGSILTARWVKDVMAGKPASARADWMQWTDHGRQVPRATRERDLFFDAQWPAIMTVPVYGVAKPSYRPVNPHLTDVLPILQQIMETEMPEPVPAAADPPPARATPPVSTAPASPEPKAAPAVPEPPTAPAMPAAPAVVVNNNPLPGAIATLARQIVLVACGWAVTKGYFGQSVADQIVPIAAGLLVLGYGQFKGWVLHTRLAEWADLLPDDVAVTR